MNGCKYFVILYLKLFMLGFKLFLILNQTAKCYTLSMLIINMRLTFKL